MLSVFLFILGLIFGSFVGALSYRLPKQISIAKGRSFCPGCKKIIAWFDNIPVVSYLLLRGKCRSCGKKISWRYPLIELLTGVVFVLIGVNPFLLFIALVLITILVIDWEHMLIPDELVFAGLAITFLYLLTTSFIYAHLLAGFAAALVLLGIYLVTLGRGMGLGDVKLAVLIGMVLGLRQSVIWLLASFLTGGVIAFILLVSKKAKLKQEIAFGPFLVFGFFVAVLLGDKLVLF